MLSAEMMLAAYASGIFPMAGSRDDAGLHWIDPRRRGIFPLDGFHLSRSLRRAIRRGDYQIRTDASFDAVVRACAARPETWINAALERVYAELHACGHAHSLEVWQDGALAGGVFGITLGGAFFGESMFSARTNASKIALAYLVDRLRQAGFTLFDTQFLTPHLASLGAVEIPRAEYHRRLHSALAIDADYCVPPVPSASELLQRMTQTS
ncbi:leucyl/phenylalanyl-tRNA--protein transferase [Albidovulum inexpectatum]|uniref:Leucyl/phenylalanyl-tRNA--protein transferase n=1 Tax=Albidovulum inexpectatum TaxID=196587 RepID=A0A2S5JID8_9RHOB|nr:leucyl/phenylalanyl-tRNA--protein transferase [Albidovulum inexpectatum]PPB81209.1 leucyl/phenylalanyl-tRNA--protein transferase [Albidovulum inexpectatum]